MNYRALYQDGTFIRAEGIHINYYNLYINCVNYSSLTVCCAVMLFIGARLFQRIEV